MSSREATPFENSGAQGTSIVVSCSICLEVISDDGERTKVKLQCGHEFHLDCIGSAFNAKGEMQCPNCRKVETGLWLYANGHRGEVNMDDWTLEDDLNDLSRPEMPFSLHWCPFSVLARLAAFQEGVSIAAAYRNLIANHAIFTEQMPASSAAHSRPHVPYFQPLQSPSLASNSADGVNDGPTFHHWTGLSGPNDTNNSHAFPSVELHHNIWDHHSPPFSPTSSRIINGTDQAQVSSIMLSLLRSDSDGVPRIGAYTHPFYLSHGSSSRTGNSVILPPFLGNYLAHAHATGLHSYHQPPNPVAVQAPVLPIVRRSTGQRGYGTIDSAPSSDQPGVYLIPSGSSGQNLPDAENNAGRVFYAWESNHFAPYPLAPIGSTSNWWGQIPHINGGSDSSGSRTMEFWHGQSTETPSSNGQTESSYQPVNPPRMHPFI